MVEGKNGESTQRLNSPENVQNIWGEGSVVICKTKCGDLQNQGILDEYNGHFLAVAENYQMKIFWMVIRWSAEEW